jgi:hypothetical protein
VGGAPVHPDLEHQRAVSPLALAGEEVAVEAVLTVGGARIEAEALLVEGAGVSAVDGDAGLGVEALLAVGLPDLDVHRPLPILPEIGAEVGVVGLVAVAEGVDPRLVAEEALGVRGEEDRLHPRGEVRRPLGIGGRGDAARPEAGDKGADAEGDGAGGGVDGDRARGLGGPLVGLVALEGVAEGGLGLDARGLHGQAGGVGAPAGAQARRSGEARAGLRLVRRAGGGLEEVGPLGVVGERVPEGDVAVQPLGPGRVDRAAVGREQAEAGGLGGQLEGAVGGEAGRGVAGAILAGCEDQPVRARPERRGGEGPRLAALGLERPAGELDRGLARVPELEPVGAVTVFVGDALEVGGHELIEAEGGPAGDLAGAREGLDGGVGRAEGGVTVGGAGSRRLARRARPAGEEEADQQAVHRAA